MLPYDYSLGNKTWFYNYYTPHGSFKTSAVQLTTTFQTVVSVKPVSFLRYLQADVSVFDQFQVFFFFIWITQVTGNMFCDSVHPNLSELFCGCSMRLFPRLPIILRSCRNNKEKPMQFLWSNVKNGSPAARCKWAFVEAISSSTTWGALHKSRMPSPADWTPLFAQALGIHPPTHNPPIYNFSLLDTGFLYF